MKHSEAVSHLRIMLTAAQKARSIMAENNLEEGAADLMPWLYHDKCVIAALEKLLNRVDGGGQVEPVEFFNMMVIAARTPAIGVIAVKRYEPLPEPSQCLPREWELESLETEKV